MVRWLVTSILIGSTLFANENVLVYRAERVKLMSSGFDVGAGLFSVFVVHIH